MKLTIKAVIATCLAVTARRADRPGERRSAAGAAVQSQDVTAYELRRFIAKRISLLPAPSQPSSGPPRPKQLRTRLLEDDVYRGWPREWVESGPRFEDLGIVASGAGYRMRKLRYEIVPGFQSTAILYEPARCAAKFRPS